MNNMGSLLLWFQFYNPFLDIPFQKSLQGTFCFGTRVISMLIFQSLIILWQPAAVASEGNYSCTVVPSVNS